MINTNVLIYCVCVYKPIYLTYVYIPVHINKIPVARSPCRLNSVRWRLSFVDSAWSTYSCHPSGAWNLEAVPRFVENIYPCVCAYKIQLRFWVLELYGFWVRWLLSNSAKFWSWCCIILTFDLVQWLILRSITASASPGYDIRVKLNWNGIMNYPTDKNFDWVTYGSFQIKVLPFEISPGKRMFACCECCVLSGRGLCDELTCRLEESYRL
jgi:hypothetical protein